MAHRKSLKLTPRFYGPFPIVQKVGPVAYKLQLPPMAAIHPKFHVSQLKRKLGQRHAFLPTLPPIDAARVLKLEPEKILDRPVRRFKN